MINFVFRKARIGQFILTRVILVIQMARTRHYTIGFGLQI